MAERPFLGLRRKGTTLAGISRAALDGVVVHGIKLLRALLFAVNVQGIESALPDAVVGLILDARRQTASRQHLPAATVFRVLAKKTNAAEFHKPKLCATGSPALPLEWAAQRRRIKRESPMRAPSVNKAPLCLLLISNPLIIPVRALRHRGWDLLDERRPAQTDPRAAGLDLATVVPVSPVKRGAGSWPSVLVLESERRMR